jgi:hypothetical protein
MASVSGWSQRPDALERDSEFDDSAAAMRSSTPIMRSRGGSTR